MQEDILETLSPRRIHVSAEERVVGGWELKVSGSFFQIDTDSENS